MKVIHFFYQDIRSFDSSFRKIPVLTHQRRCLLTCCFEWGELSKVDVMIKAHAQPIEKKHF